MLRVFSEGLSSSGVKYFIGDITIIYSVYRSNALCCILLYVVWINI